MHNIRLQEGPALNYFRPLHELFGGDLKEDSYRVDNALVRIRINSYRAEPGLELMIGDSWHEEEIMMDRDPDGIMDLVHINLALDGAANQSFRDREVTMAANSLSGAFLYNGLFPMRVRYPARQNYLYVSIKIHRETLLVMMPEALDLFDELFHDPLGVGYHASVPPELEKLCREILHYRDTEFGGSAMVISRGIEALVLIFNKIRKMRKEKQLNGLHPDDFERLQEIKEWIHSRLEEKFSLEQIASEFGISISKLKRDFKSLFECSVHQFYNRARMDEAYRRLKSGKYSVMEVGYDLGYQNLSKFSEMFRKLKGISTSEVI